MKKIFSVFLICFLVLLGSVRAELLEGVVRKVSDGDTVWVRLENGNRVKIRVWGIDTPEKFRSKKLEKEANRCRVGEGSVVGLGKLASKRARELLAGRRVLIEPHGRGYHRRLLARILVDGRDFGLLMIEEGYACVYRRAAPPEYFRAQREAAGHRRGLWDINYELMRCLCKCSS